MSKDSMGTYPKKISATERFTTKITLKFGGFWAGNGTISWNLVIDMFNAMPVENILPRVWDLIKWNTWNGWSWFWTDGESTLWLRHFEETSNFRSNNGWQDFQECPGKDSTMWLTGYYVFPKCPPAYIQHIPKVPPAYIQHITKVMPPSI